MYETLVNNGINYHITGFIAGFLFTMNSIISTSLFEVDIMGVDIYM